MDMYQSNLTSLQEGILRFLFTQHPRRFNGRAIASRLSVSQTAIHNSLPTLEKEGLIIVEKDKESKRLSIGLNKDNPRTFHLKRVENLRNIY